MASFARIPLRISAFPGGRRALVISSSLLVILIHVAALSSATYVPYRPYDEALMRRQDSDYDDIDSGASAPYQSQENNNQADDGYEDVEPDGPYDETPRDEEGQADLEKFFDDHLGASERDGMDKENLPTNLQPIFVMNPRQESEFGRRIHHHASVGQSSLSPSASVNDIVGRPRTSYLDHSVASPNIQTSYIKLPNKRLIIRRQVFRGPIFKGDLGHPQLMSIPPLPEHLVTEARDGERQRHLASRDNKKDTMTTRGSDVIATEDDDEDPVFITTNTNRPFKIDALGGYDPEEDFKDASQDLEESSKSSGSSSDQRSHRGAQAGSGRDISFYDPEADMMFNDASETDEVIFDHDPYQTDLEAEMHGSTSERPRKAADEVTGEAETDADSSEGRPVSSRSDPVSEEDAEGSWINDGADDMDVPSQKHQDDMLERAVKAEDLARRNAADEEEAAQQEADQSDGENQRMPNADYMKNDLKMNDEDYK